MLYDSGFGFRVAALGCFIVGILCAFGVVAIGEHKVGTETISTVDIYSYKEGSINVQTSDINESNNQPAANILGWSAAILVVLAAIFFVVGLVLWD